MRECPDCEQSITRALGVFTGPTCPTCGGSLTTPKAVTPMETPTPWTLPAPGSRFTAVDPVERAHRVSRMRGSRAGLISEARRLREEIAQLFTEAAAWNDARPPGEAPLDPDPDGALARIADELDRWLALTTQTG